MCKNSADELTTCNDYKCIWPRVTHVQRTCLSAGVRKHMTRKACIEAAIQTNISCYQWWSGMWMQCCQTARSQQPHITTHALHTNTHTPYIPITTGHSRLKHLFLLPGDDLAMCEPCRLLLTVRHILVEYIKSIIDNLTYQFHIQKNICFYISFLLLFSDFLILLPSNISTALTGL